MQEEEILKVFRILELEDDVKRQRILSQKSMHPKISQKTIIYTTADSAARLDMKRDSENARLD
jgi:hypothetical protein